MVKKDIKEKRSEQHRRWFAKNKESQREYQRRWYLENKEYAKERYKAYLESKGDEWVAAFKERKQQISKIYFRRPDIRYAKYKRGSAERGIYFDLTFEQFMEFWNNPCRYCGADIQTIGLDRVDNNIGYIIGNVVPCCEICNYMKRTMSDKIFIEHCQKIVAFQLRTTEST